MKSEMDLQKAAIKTKAMAFGQRMHMAAGGQAKKQGEGLIQGPGTGTSDSIPLDLPSGAKIKASRNEFIIPADSTAAIGPENLQAMVDATHTPVAQERFGRANGGSTFSSNSPSALYQQNSAEQLRGRTGGPSHVVYGQPGGLATGVAANPQQALGNFQPATPTSLVQPSFGSLSLPATAAPAIPQVGMYGGMQTISAGPSVSVPSAGADVGTMNPTAWNKAFGFADGGAVASPANKDRILSMANGGAVPCTKCGVPHTGYCDGGRVAMAEGGSLEEQLARARARFPRRPPGLAEPYPTPEGVQVQEGAGVKANPQPAPEGTKYYDPKAVRQALPNASTGYAADGTMKAETLMAQKNAAITEGLAKEGAGIGQKAETIVDKAKGVFGRGASAVGDAAAATPGLLKSALGNYAAGAVAYGPAEKAVQDQMDPAARNARQAVRGVTGWKSSLAEDAADTLGHIGNAATFGYAGKLGDYIADRLGGAPSTQSSVPSTKNYNQDTPAPPQAVPSFVPQGQQGVAAPQNTMISPDARGEFIRSPQADTKYHNLGDYNSPGAQMFGRASKAGGPINDFSGVGVGGHVPDSGVTLGITPEQLAAYKAGASGSSFGYPSAPQYQESAEALAARDQVTSLANRAASLGPGKQGFKRTNAQLDAATRAYATLHGGDQNKNAFNQQSFGHANQFAQHQLGLNNQFAIARGQLGLGQAQMDANWSIKKAEFANIADQKAWDRTEANRKDTEEDIKQAAVGELGDTPEAKQLGAQLWSVATSKKYQDPDKPNDPNAKLYFWQANKLQRAAIMGDLRHDVFANQLAQQGGDPGSAQGAHQLEPAGMLGSTLSFIKHPGQTWMHGAVKPVGGSFLSSAPNILPTTEAYAAEQRRGKFGEPQR